MFRTKSAVALVLAFGVLAATAGGASAVISRLSIERAGRIELPSQAKLKFTDESGTRRVECEVRLRGILRQGPIEVRAGEAFGEIAEVAIVNCVGGTVDRALFFIAERSVWPIVSETVNGGEPKTVRDMTFRVVGVRIRFEAIGAATRCLYEGEFVAHLELRQIARESTSYTTGTARLREEIPLRLAAGATCPRMLVVEGSLKFEAAQTFTFQ